MISSTLIDKLFDRILDITTKFAMCARSGGIGYSVVGSINFLYMHSSLIAKLILETDSSIEALRVLLYLTYTACVGLCIALRPHETTLNSLIERSRRNLYNYDNPAMQVDYELSIDRDAFKRKLCLLTAAMYLCALIIVASSVILSIIQTIDRTSRSYEEFLIVPVWYPFRIDTYSRYVIANVWLTVSTCLAIPNVLSPTILCLYLNAVIKIEAESALRVMKCADHRLIATKVDDDDDGENNNHRLLLHLDEADDDEMFASFMRHSYRHQGAICDFAVRTKYCFAKVLVAFIGFLLISILLNTYMIVKDRDLFQLIQRISGLGLSLFVLFYLCHLGQTISEISDRYRYRIYKCRWYVCSIATQKLVLRSLIICRQQNLSISFTPNNVLSFLLLARTLRADYTALNFLLAKL